MSPKHSARFVAHGYIRGERRKCAVGEVKIVNVAGPAYLKKFGKPKDLDDLKNHRLVNYVTALGEKPDGFEYFDGERNRQIKLKSSISVATIDAYKAAALAGLGICQNPKIGVRQYLKSGELIEVLPAFAPGPRATPKSSTRSGGFWRSAFAPSSSG